MIKKLFAVLAIAPLFSIAQKLTTRFEQSKGTETATYFEIIDWWKKLATVSATIKLMEMGPTDAGYPLHLVLISTEKDFNIPSIKRKKKSIILVNNGIHPGEPDGIDASMILARNIIEKKFSLPANVVLAIIPVYNIGGALNRSNYYRVDQNGPIQKGFRGNAQNLDLNRDFIKADSRNALSFAKIFHYLDPDVFIDNHVSNGADYQHVMTLLTTQHNKLGGSMGTFINKQFEPGVYTLMKAKGFDLVPYVNHFGNTPDKGWKEFWDGPRYSSGYASLWHTFSFVPETHMLKPYQQRVDATRALMESFIDFTAKNAETIISLREERKRNYLDQKMVPIVWKWDSATHTEIEFKGYEASYKQSAVSGLQRLYYDRNKAYTKKVPFYNRYVDTITIEKPAAYVVPQGWWRVIERLQANSVQMRRLTGDTIIEVEVYHIEQYQSLARPYEGHHPNHHVEVSKEQKKLHFRKGDYYIPLNQKANRFLMEVLEPQGEDSYFTWNFFDPILSQKEGFSDYAFEETAAEYLRANPELNRKLEQKKISDTTFANSAVAQLNFVYQNSPYAEPAYLHYPVYRIIK